MYRWDVEEAARLIDHHQLSSMIGPAAVTGDLLRLAQAGKYSLASLQVLGGGGAPRAPEQVRQIGKSFTQALPGTGWGMTETNAIGCGIGGQDYLDRPASSGRSSVVLDLRSNPGGLLTAERARTLLPGMYVRVRVEQGVRPGTITVPQQAVMRTADGSMVMTVDAEGKVAPRPVKTDGAYGSNWIIGSGLKAGDTVIVE
jgi:long-chain acyl-CoA synthetase